MGEQLDATCRHKPVPVTFLVGRRYTVEWPCWRCDEVAPGRVIVCPRCDGKGHMPLAFSSPEAALLAAAVGPAWATCSACEGRRAVYLIDEIQPSSVPR